MSEITKKIAAVVLTFALAFAVVAPVVVAEDNGEDTVADLQQQITDLTAIINQLKAQLEGTTAPTTPSAGVPAACASVTAFNVNLTVGSRGADVKCLQAMLNLSADTQVAASGVGSLGQETEYFGPLTRAAVVKFQNKYASEVLTPIGLTAGTGFVGMQTRAKLNAMLAAGVTDPADPADPADPVDPADPITGEEGELSVSRRSDIRNVELYTNDNAKIAMFRIEAEDSPIRVQRIDVHFGGFDSGNDTTRENFINWFTEIAIYDGGTKLGEMDINRNTIDRDSNRVRFSGLNLVVPKDGYKDITIEVTTSDTKHASPEEVYLGFPKDVEAIRGVDGAGLTKCTKDTANDVYNSFKLMGEGTGVLEVRRSANTPEEGIVLVSDSSVTEVELLRFTIKAKETKVDLEKMKIALSMVNPAGGAIAASAISNHIQDLVLYQGTTRLDVASVDNSGEAVFEFDYSISKDSTREFVVKADVLSVEKAKDQGFAVMAFATISDNTGIGYDAFDTAVSFDRQIDGYFQALYIEVPHATLRGQSIAIDTDADVASGQLIIDVKALEGDIYLTKEGVTIFEEGPATGAKWDVLRDFKLGTAVETNVLVDANHKLVLTANALNKKVRNVSADLTAGAPTVEAVQTALAAILNGASDPAGYYLVTNTNGTGFTNKVFHYTGTGVTDTSITYYADHYFTDLFKIAAGDTKEIRFNAVSIEKNAWRKLEVDKVNWYVEDGNKYYHFQFDKDVHEDVDVLETESKFLPN